MSSDVVVQHDDGTPTGSRSTSFFIRGIPWAGCLVHIHEVVEKAGGEVFRCSLSGRATGRWLEIPAWMFDRAAGATWRVGAAPYVDIAVLTALATLLQDMTSVSGAPSQLRDSSAALGSHDANRGDVHAAPAYRSPSSSQQCTSVRSVLRPALRRGAEASNFYRQCRMQLQQLRANSTPAVVLVR
jgi:hypothetical protein